MAVGLDADADYARRSSIPSGGAGTLSGGGFSDCFVGVWVYRPSSVTYATTAAGSIIHFQAGAREVVLGFNSAGSNLSDLNLQIIYNSGGGSGTPALFSGHTGASFLDEWVYYFIYENSANSQVAGYIRLADLATAVTLSRANDNAGSQYVNTLTFGNNSSGNAVAAGYYAYARAVNSTSLTSTNALTYAASAVTESGDWGFWPLDDNTDTADDSGNSRTLTFGGTLTSETSPTLGGGGFDASGALASDAATISGTATHLTLHSTTGALAAQAASIAGTAAHVHAALGALAAQNATIAGSADHRTLHTATGALAAQAASLSGAAAHVHATAGALAAQAATIAGSASRADGGADFTAVGALAAQDAAVAGSATHLTLHTASGALQAQAAAVSGAAAHVHAALGVLAAQDATITGAAVHQVLHTAAGALAAQASTIAGAAAHVHAAAGALAADPATMSGTADHVAAGVFLAAGALASANALLSGSAEHTARTPRKVGSGGGARSNQLRERREREARDFDLFMALLSTGVLDGQSEFVLA